MSLKWSEGIALCCVMQVLDQNTIRSINSDLSKCRFEEPVRTDMRFPHCDACIALPEGVVRHCYFTLHKGQPACFLLEMNGQHAVTKGEMVLAAFDPSLAAGTLVKGTLLSCKNKRFFVVWDLILLCSRDVSDKSYEIRTAHLPGFFSSVAPCPYTQLSLTFASPIEASSFKHCSKLVADLPYTLVDMLYVRKGTVPSIRSVQRSQKKGCRSSPCIMTIEADATHDIYRLRPYNSPVSRVAAVQSLAESRKLNCLFREIRENNDLDLTEMSEDEEFFEDIGHDKYLKKCPAKTVECVYDFKMKRWVILDVKQGRVASEQNIARIENQSTR